MMVIGKMAKKMGMEYNHTQIVIFMKDNGKMTKKMVEEH